LIKQNSTIMSSLTGLIKSRSDDIMVDIEILTINKSAVGTTLLISVGHY
jgi:hypothetical protein